jgi:hypothetical protein
MRNLINFTNISIGPKDLYREMSPKIRLKWYTVNANKSPMTASDNIQELWATFTMIEWCMKNCTGRWSVEQQGHSVKPIFYFKTVRDRLAFILAWC